ncbi:excisionase family DNA binding protein [Thermosporothrix hazakensis]|jgi:excisionase family DNA binding protein|uniref:Excisionase family DNA binding protein n=1 Tax=Thermosporothrix hazakensis TaxID=644383 RepID=A0A326U1H1_THEHA|nr:excisionase family DNA binding protein [Thermosporothrix hazakensis]
MEKLLTIPEVARRLRVNRATIWRWVRDRIIPAVDLPKYGKRNNRRISEKTLECILNGGNSNAN